MDAVTHPIGTEQVRRGDRALTLREAEDRYGIPAHRLRQYRSERVLDFFKLGRALFVSERSLIDFLESHREPATIGSPTGAAMAV
jgi:hypothetical protein